MRGEGVLLENIRKIILKVVIGLTLACCVLLAVFLLLMCSGCAIETIVNIVIDIEK